jgi:hypothetical protein
LESVTILRELFRLRLAVVIVGLISLLIAYAIAFGLAFPPQSRSYTVGIANARILVDTPNSQVVEVAPKGSETLGARANVLANLMVDGEVKDAIAREAGLDPKQLVAGSISTGGPEEEDVSDERVYTLTTGVVLNSDMSELPIISVEAQAPNTGSAIALADAAVSGLSKYLDTRAENQRIEDTRRLQVSGLGRAQGHEETRGTGKLAAIAAAIFVFVSGCVAVLLISALARGWRTAAALEREFDDELGYSGLFDEELNGTPSARVDEGETAGIRT